MLASRKENKEFLFPLCFPMVAAKDGGSFPSVGSPWSFSDSETSQNICKEHLLICICTFGKANSGMDIK